MNHKLAIIIPYRNRKEHLDQFVPYMKEFLTNSNIDFSIVVVEQANENKFNRGKLINIGFDLEKNNCTYISPHDVDLLPESSDYSVPEVPTHLAAYRSQSNYRLEYDTFFGGVNLFLNEHFTLINGFSNLYPGYGAEDDDLFLRCVKKGLRPIRREGRYKSLPHGYENITDDMVKQNKNQYLTKMNDASSMNNDGLTTLDYEVINKSEDDFIHYKVNFT